MQAAITQRSQVRLNGPAIILGSAAIGIAAGTRFGGGAGALTGALVGAMLGAIAAGTLKSATITVAPGHRAHLHLEFR